VIHVLVADDHAVVRRGVSQILALESDFTVIGEAADYNGIRRILKESRCDVLVLDVQLPGKNGIDIAKALKEENPRLGTLILSSFPEEQYAVRALRAGARGYVSKGAPPELIVEAVRAVAAGRRYISATAASALADSLSGERPEAPHESLSDREFQVLKLIAGGKRLAEIAEELSLSPKTVSVYRARLLDKMDLKSNAALTHYAMKNQLLEQE
jgi:two-component system, NarL family, invasion response regulator UvrY